MIASVNRRNNSGGGGPFALAGQQIRIRSMGGAVEVPNPDWDGADTTPRTTTRNYNFGGQQGQAWLEDAGGNRTALADRRLERHADLCPGPAGTAPGDYQVIVTRTGGVPAPVDSPIGVTLTVGVNVGGTEYGVRAECRRRAVTSLRALCGASASPPSPPSRRRSTLPPPAT